MSVVETLKLALPGLPRVTTWTPSVRNLTGVMSEDRIDVEASIFEGEKLPTLYTSLRPMIVFNAVLLGYFALYFIARHQAFPYV
mmetsp:Transcript_6846/g.20822  ORF Transcript_6846/g.20822 Transcript_6846/m.20822 type:complete len:84 (-) Transcript_6846:1161-1412(-)